MKTLKDLVVAMINATLILVAVCLFFLWQLSNTAERVSASFAQNLEVLEPLKTEVQAMKGEVAGLRGDLAEMQAVPGQAMDKVEARIESLNARLDGVQARMDQLAETPERLMTVAIDRSAEHLAGTVKDLRGCSAPES